jgi:hypothetical protein
MMTTLRQAFRSLMWRPGFTLTALLTLTLGIGVCTAMFSVVDAVLLKPVGIVDEDRFVMAGEASPTADVSRGAYSPTTSPVVFFEWRDRHASRLRGRRCPQQRRHAAVALE